MPVEYKCKVCGFVGADEEFMNEHVNGHTLEEIRQNLLATNETEICPNCGDTLLSHVYKECSSCGKYHLLAPELIDHLLHNAILES